NKGLLNYVIIKYHPRESESKKTELIIKFSR
ncbi:MAG: hypothetical protein ACI9K4_000679, partial [Polaribacter sp.]